MEPLVHIEKATAADFQSIADIYNEHIALGNATMDDTPKQAHDIAQWEADFNDREGLFVLKGSRRVLGWGIIKRYSDREGYRFACETAVYLTHDELGKGYGSLMKKHLSGLSRCFGACHG